MAGRLPTVLTLQGDHLQATIQHTTHLLPGHQQCILQACEEVLLIEERLHGEEERVDRK